MSKPWKVGFLVALGVGLLVLAYTLRSVFIPVLVALLLAYVLNPLVTMLERRRVPRLLSIAAVYAVLLGMVALVAFWAVPAAVRQGTAFVQDIFVKENAKIHGLAGRAEPYLKKYLGVGSWKESMALLREKTVGAEADAAKVVGRALAVLFSRLTGGLSGLFTAFSFLALVPVYLFFLLNNLNPWWDRFTRWIPPAYRPRTLGTLGRIHRANMAFFRGQMTLSLIEGVILFVGLEIIGAPYPLLFGLLYAVLSVVPYLGVTTLFTVVELAVLADTGEFGTRFFATVGLFALIQVLESMVLQPMILGKETGLHPIAIILALLAFGQLWGFFGMLIAVPLACTTKILLEDYIGPMFQEVTDEPPAKEASSI